MGLLPAIPMLLLAVVAAWLFWPLVADPIARLTNPARRVLRQDADRMADQLFASWTERG